MVFRGKGGAARERLASTVVDARTTWKLLRCPPEKRYYNCTQVGAWWVRDLALALVGLAEPQELRADHRRLWFVKLLRLWSLVTLHNGAPACETLAR